MANAMSTTMTVRMDKQVKQEAQQIFSKLGLDMTTAINIFLRKAIAFKGLPFDVCLEEPNDVTLAAMAEADEMSKHPERYKSYASFDELMKDVMVAEAE